MGLRHPVYRMNESYRVAKMHKMPYRYRSFSCKRALWIVALLRKMTCNLRYPIGFCHFVCITSTEARDMLIHIACGWVTSHTNESCHRWMSHVTYEWVMSNMNEARITQACHVRIHRVNYKWVIVRKSHVTYEWVMSHKWVTYHWGMSRANTSCPL